MLNKIHSPLSEIRSGQTATRNEHNFTSVMQRCFKKERRVFV